MHVLFLGFLKEEIPVPVPLIMTGESAPVEDEEDAENSESGRDDHTDESCDDDRQSFSPPSSLSSNVCCTDAHPNYQSDFFINSVILMLMKYSKGMSCVAFDMFLTLEGRLRQFT